MPKAGSQRKKTRTHKVDEENEEDDGIPKSFIIKRGKIGIFLKELQQNIRELMYPYTALKLRESKKNSLKDFLGVAGSFGVSHMMILTQTEKSNYIRFVKNPKGPTITMKIDEYALSRDIQSYMALNKKNAKIFSMTLQSPPLLIMNGFGGRDDTDPYKICSLMLQSMFPPLKVQALNLSTCKRIVLFNLLIDKVTGEEYIEFRHYGISARQRAVNKTIKKLVNNGKVPDMSKFNDLADFILHNKSSGFSSESEIDDLPESKITLPEAYGDKAKNTQVAIRLHELGPRMKLQLVKIEEGFCRGNVNFHAHIKKSKSEIKKQQDGLKGARELKEKRKKQQEENVQKKEDAKEAMRRKSRGEDPEDPKSKDKKKKDENDGSDAEGADNADDNTTPDDKKKIFANYQKKRVVPNISSGKVRAAGISKGMWKKELKEQMGISTSRSRRGIREKSGEKTSEYRKFRGAGSKSKDRKGADSTKVTLGKRTKTATDHGKGKNTTTFKSQKKQKTS